MTSLVGVHTLELLPEVGRDEFEDFMNKEVFSVTAEVPGSMNRGGVSSIKSQHLIKKEGESNVYLWLIKSSGTIADSLFPNSFHQTYKAVKERLETFVATKGSTLFTVVDSYEVGIRDSLGRPIDDPITDKTI